MVGSRLVTLSILALGVAVLPSSLVFGQEITGTISGVVHDPAGAVMAGVSVTARETQSGLTRTVVTNETGSYRIPSLPIGEYEVGAEASGFNKQLQRGITLAVAQEAVVNLTLQVGDVTQQVTVEAEAQLVNTTLSSTSGLVRQQQVADLPLNGRSFLDLVTLNAGSSSNRSNTSNDDNPSYSISGSRPEQNRFVINGIDETGNNPQRIYTTPQGMSGYLMGLDAVQEFNVQEGTYGAEYGKRAGGQVIIATKSGTDLFHGSAFEYFRNTVLDSRNFFDTANPSNPTGGVPPFQRNQFGGSFGGPIRKYKMFIFGNTELYRERQAETLYGYVPSLEYRQGLLPNASGQYVPVPNLVPGMLSFFDYWPVPNGPELLKNGLPTGIATYSADPKRRVQENYEMVRFDYNISSKDRFYGFSSVDRGFRYDPVDPLFNTDTETDLYANSVQETHIFSPALLNIATIGFSRAYSSIVTDPDTPFPSNTLLLSGPSRNNPGSVSITGGGFLSNAGSNAAWIDRQIFGVSDDVKLFKGIHNLEMGVWFQRTYAPQYSVTANSAGTVTFPTLASFLTDQPTNFLVQSDPTELDFLFLQGAWYFQDEIRLRKNLTVRLGLRDEFEWLPREEHGHSSNYEYSPDGTTLLTQPFMGNSPFLVNNGKALWQPRVGLVWDPTGTGTWAVRASFGIHNDLQDNIGNRLIRNQPFNGNITYLNTPLLSIIPVSSALPPPPQCTVLGQTNPPCVLYAPAPLDPTLHYPTVIQRGLIVEHQLAQNYKLEVSYMGSQSYNLPVDQDSNTIQPLVCQKAAGCLAGGVLPSGIKANVVPMGTSYFPVGARPNPLLGSGTGGAGWWYFGTGNYNALKVSLTKRLSGGLTFKSNYVWSKVMDLNSATLAGGATNDVSEIFDRFNRRLSWGPAAFSLKHEFNTNASYQLPFGNGKKFFSGASGWVDKLVGGWQWNGVITVTDGFPITMLIGANNTGSGNTANVDVPNVMPNCNPILGVDSFKKTGLYFNPQCFSLPAAGTFGDESRGDYRGPGFWNIDTSLFKRVPLKERLNLQFRWEIFNVMNHANFSPPNTNIFSGTAYSAAAGTITTTTNIGNGRQMQLALRLEF